MSTAPSSFHWRDWFDSFGGLDVVVSAVQGAGSVVMDIYERGVTSSTPKADGSPLTEADRQSSDFLKKVLTRIPGVDFVSEESGDDELSGFQNSPLYWLVDPLDGTKEFINRNGEFTVNAALIAEGIPVVGVIGVPAMGEVYAAVLGEGAKLITSRGESRVFNDRASSELVCAVSRSHRGSELFDFLNRHGIQHEIECGSALKFCRLAAGACDLYPRIGRTMEWDVAAGHCILMESNCELLELASLSQMRYGKPGFANPSFIAQRRGLKLSEREG